MHHPIVTLSNKITVVNFSSPHSFKFIDGSELPPCDEQTVKMLALEPIETEIKRYEVKWVDIEIQYRMTPEVKGELRKLAEMVEIDIILAPLVVLKAIEAEVGAPFNWSFYLPIRKKVRTGRVADRMTKVHYIDKFCV
jgi:hypothetical protein